MPLDENDRWKWFPNVLHGVSPLSSICIKSFLLSIFSIALLLSYIVKQSNQVSWRIQD